MKIEVNEYLPKVAPLCVECLDERDEGTEVRISSISGETMECVKAGHDMRVRMMGDTSGLTNEVFGNIGTIEGELHGPLNITQNGKRVARVNE